MTPIRRPIAFVLFAALAGCTAPPPEPPPDAPTPDCCATTPDAPDDPAETLQLPDVTLVNQDGKAVRLRSDVIGKRVVLVNFVFTSCTTSCPLLGGVFGEVQHHLGTRLGPEFGLVSISVDPTTDTPERLREYGKRYAAGPGWSLLTGSKADVDRVLKAFGAYTPDKQNHPSTVVAFDGATGRARRVGSTPAAPRLAALAAQMVAERPPPAPADASAALKYFTDTPLVDQAGRPVRFYTDLVRGKTVVINTFFSSCTGSCVKLADSMKAFQEKHPGRLGKDLHLISISVDPETDRPAVLREYAARVGAKAGWHFLTGDKGNVDFVLGKLGQLPPTKDAHSPILLIGNDRTGLWKKGFGLSAAAALAPVLDGVLDDPG